MKALVIFCLFSVTSYSQIYYDYYLLNFEDTTHYGRLFIDTISYPDNIWQIGTPQKNILNAAYSLPNAIITDTINPYPINDTSVFIVIHKVDLALSSAQRMVLSGFYKVDSDSLKDFGLIEYSPDNGISWLDMINDESFVWWSDKPVLTGSSDGTYFYVSFDDLGYDLRFGDTVRFRFTFISDSIQNNRDGLMYDDLFFEDYYEGIDSWFHSKFYSMVLPNPADKWVTIEFDNKMLSPVHLEIIDNSGRLILKESGGEQGSFKVDLYMHDPGNGSVIRDYDDFINGVNNYTWSWTLKMTTSATSCPLYQHITGNLNNTTSTYKAQQDILAECLISSGSDVHFECGRHIILEDGFEIQLGCTVLLESGETVICP